MGDQLRSLEKLLEVDGLLSRHNKVSHINDYSTNTGQTILSAQSTGNHDQDVLTVQGWKIFGQRGVYLTMRLVSGYEACVLSGV
jgi:hypothetical protein